MASYRVEWKRPAEKNLQKLPAGTILKILEAVANLADDPHPPGSMKLAGSEATFRIRIGNYRVIYEIFEARLLIEIQRAGHRKDIYRK